MNAARKNGKSNLCVSFICTSAIMQAFKHHEDQSVHTSILKTSHIKTNTIVLLNDEEFTYLLMLVLAENYFCSKHAGIRNAFKLL